MASHTTVAIDQDVRRKLKKLASLLDISQGEVIKQALTLMEDKIITGRQQFPSTGSPTPMAKNEIAKILEDATKKVWETKPEIKRIQEKLFSGPETIDDFIINEWDAGLE